MGMVFHTPSSAQLKALAESRKAAEAERKTAEAVDRAIHPKTPEGIVRARGW